MTGALDARRRKLLYRSIHCGTKEMDMIMGGFARHNIAALDDRQLDLFERLLGQQDIDLYRWISGQEAPPPEFDNDVLAMIKQFKYSPDPL